MDKLLGEIRSCETCKDYLPFFPKPVLRANPKSRILIVGQAPGTKVQNTGIPWNDASGKELRRWMGVSDETFYNEEIFAIVPMGFCYPGKGKSGDLPPRKECAPLWHRKLLDQMPHIELTILIGIYAHQYYLKDLAEKNLTENVRNYKRFLPDYFPLVHPSPRNKLWQKRNPWFEHEVVPELRQTVQQILRG